MERLKIGEDSKNILISSFATPGINILMNVIILLIFPLLEPFLEGLFLGIINPFIPTTPNIINAFGFLFIAIIFVVFFVYGITITLNILSLLISYIVKKQLKVKIKKVKSQNRLVKIMPIASIALTITTLILLMNFRIFPVPQSLFASGDLSSGAFSNTVIVAAIELHSYVVLVIIIAMIFNGVFKLIINYSYYKYFKDRKILLKEVMKTEYEVR